MTRQPDFDAVRDKRTDELTPAQREDAHELWLREHPGHMVPFHREHVAFLLRRLDEARGAPTVAPPEPEPRESRPVASYTGWILTGAGRIQIDFEVPLTAGDETIDAAAWRALLDQVPGDLLQIGQYDPLAPLSEERCRQLWDLEDDPVALVKRVFELGARAAIGATPRLSAIQVPEISQAACRQIVQDHGRAPFEVVRKAHRDGVEAALRAGPRAEESPGCCGRCANDSPRAQRPCC